MFHGLTEKEVIGIVNGEPLVKIPFEKTYSTFFYRQLYSHVPNDILIELRGVENVEDKLIEVFRDIDEFPSVGASGIAFDLLCDKYNELEMTFRRVLTVVSVLRYEDVYKEDERLKYADNWSYFEPFIVKTGKIGLCACYCYLKYLRKIEGRGNSHSVVSYLMGSVIATNEKELYALAIKYYADLLADHQKNSKRENTSLVERISDFKTFPVELIQAVRRIFATERYDKEMNGEDFSEFLLHWEREGEHFLQESFKNGDTLIKKCGHCELPKALCVKRAEMDKKNLFQKSLKRAMEFLSSNQNDEALKQLNVAISMERNSSGRVRLLRRDCYFQRGNYLLALADHVAECHTQSHIFSNDVQKSNVDYVEKVVSLLPKEKKEVVKMIWSREYNWKSPKLLKSLKYFPHFHGNFGEFIPGRFSPYDANYPKKCLFVNNNSCYSLSALNIRSGKKNGWGWSTNDKEGMFKTISDLFLVRRSSGSLLMLLIGRSDCLVKIFEIEENSLSVRLLVCFPSGYNYSDIPLISVRCHTSERLVFVASQESVNVFKIDPSWQKAEKRETLCGFGKLRRMEVFGNNLFVADHERPVCKILEYSVENMTIKKGYVPKAQVELPKARTNSYGIRTFAVSEDFVVSGDTDGNVYIFRRNQTFEKFALKLMPDRIACTDISIENKTNLAVIGYSTGFVFIVDCCTSNILFRCDRHNKAPTTLSNDSCNCVIASNLRVKGNRSLELMTVGYGDMKILIQVIPVKKKSCGSCGKRGSKQKPLLKCGRCKKVYFYFFHFFHFFFVIYIYSLSTSNVKRKLGKYIRVFAKY